MPPFPTPKPKVPRTSSLACRLVFTKFFMNIGFELTMSLQLRRGRISEKLRYFNDITVGDLNFAHFFFV